jgi:hypothetical protein
MIDPVSATISVFALAISATTAWLTLFRRGSVRMTQPTVVFFGPDIPRVPEGETFPKVFLRTLLFATARRGRVIESMYVSLSRNETTQNFNVWVYGDEKLLRGSGLFIGETGIAANHHFLAPRDGHSFRFTEGVYRMSVYAHLLGDRARTLLFAHSFEISRDVAAILRESEAGVYFDWGSDSSSYLPHVEKRLRSRQSDDFLEPLGATSKAPS